MSQAAPYDDDPDHYEDELEEQMGCDFGAEFCEDPQTKAMGLCTTSCALYFKMVELQEYGPMAEVYFKQMNPFFWAMAYAMSKADKEKRDSWKTCSLGYLEDKIGVQLEDMVNRPGEEDYMANLGNYAYMIWRHEKAAQGELPLDFGEGET